MNFDDWSDQSGEGENDGQYKNIVAAETHHFLAAREQAYFPKCQTVTVTN